MIYCNLNELEKYAHVHPNLAKVSEWLKTHKYQDLAPGRTDIDGDNVFVMNIVVDSYTNEDAMYEAHELYADVQVLVDENEWFYFTTKKLREKVPFDKKGDVVLYYFDNKGICICPQIGECLVFLPGEVHLPKMSSKPQKLKKVIFKVKMK